MAKDGHTKYNPRQKNGHRRRNIRARLKAMGMPCAICGRPIHYDEPSDADHPLSFVVDEINPVSRFREFGYDTPTQAALDWNNVQAVHYICNARKGARTMREFQKRVETITRSNFLDGEW